jgi:hypothetical protein
LQTGGKAAKAKEAPMSGCYVGKVNVESKDFDWLELIVLAARRATDSNERMSKEMIGQVLQEEFGIGPAQAGAWFEGVDVLTEYMMADLNEGDALIEESEAVAASRRAFRAVPFAPCSRRVCSGASTL